MNSIANVVVTKYGPAGEAQPVFRCPVVIAPKALTLLEGQSDQVESTVENAAQAADLIGCFGDNSEYVDFASEVELSEGVLPISMRAELVKAQLGNVVRIDIRTSAAGVC